MSNHRLLSNGEAWMLFSKLLKNEYSHNHWTVKRAWIQAFCPGEESDEKSPYGGPEESFENPSKTGNKRNEKRFHRDRTVSCTWSAAEPDLQDQDLTMYRQVRQKGTADQPEKPPLHGIQQMLIDYAKGSHFWKRGGPDIHLSPPSALSFGESTNLLIRYNFFRFRNHDQPSQSDQSGKNDPYRLDIMWTLDQPPRYFSENPLTFSCISGRFSDCYKNSMLMSGKSISALSKSSDHPP